MKQNEGHLRDEQSRRQWRRIAKEGMNFLTMSLAAGSDMEKAQELKKAVQTIKAEQAISYDWEESVREALPELLLLDRIYEDKGWLWEEAYTHPQRLTVVRNLAEEYRVSENPSLSMFCHLPAKTVDKHGGAIIFATVNERFTTESLRNSTMLKPIFPDGLEMTVWVSLWHKANLIPTEI